MSSHYLKDTMWIYYCESMATFDLSSAFARYHPQSHSLTVKALVTLNILYPLSCISAFARIGADTYLHHPFPHLYTLLKFYLMEPCTGGSFNDILISSITRLTPFYLLTNLRSVLQAINQSCHIRDNVCSVCYPFTST